MSTALTLVQPDNKPSSLAVVQDTLEALKAIRTFLESEFKPGLDFGVIPGTGTKPTLLLPGAQKAMMYFNVAPHRDIQRVEMGGGHLEVLATTQLVSRTTGGIVGEGSGSCSSMEKKYRYRHADRLCPKCGTPNIKASKYGDQGWYCHAKAGGCGAQFRPNDPAINDQVAGKVENPDVHDTRNTILKMAIKRADVSAAMSLACLSERFTQDLEDTYDLSTPPTPEPPPAPEPTPAPRPAPAPPAPANNHKAKDAWGGQGNPKPAPAPSKPQAPAATPAAPATPGERVPVSGGSLWRWAAEVEKREGRGMIGHILDRARGLGWPQQMKTWTPQQVQEAYQDAVETIDLIYSNADPDDDEGPVSWDDGRYDGDHG
jgi:hypothetical protein